MICPSCKGTGKMELTIQTYGEATVRKSSIGCITCGESGTITKEKKAQLDAEYKMWCRCEDSDDSEFRDDGECNCGVHKHHYHCVGCGKITQIG
jgi:hypothetical protein